MQNYYNNWNQVFEQLIETNNNKSNNVSLKLIFRLLSKFSGSNLPTVEIKDHNVMLEGKTFFDQPKKMI